MPSTKFYKGKSFTRKFDKVDGRRNGHITGRHGIPDDIMWMWTMWGVWLIYSSCTNSQRSPKLIFIFRRALLRYIINIFYKIVQSLSNHNNYFQWFSYQMESNPYYIIIYHCRHHISSDEDHTSPDDGQLNAIRNIGGKTKRKEGQHYIILVRVYIQCT